MRKKMNAVLIIMLLMISTVDVSATPGNLKSKSAKIIQCNGKNYGHHGDGHWHEGNQNANGSWSAIGPSLGYDNPCGGGASSPAPAAAAEPIPFVATAPVESEADKSARIEAERVAEEERVAATKKAEEERIAAEKKAEEERIAAEKRAEKERIRKEKEAEIKLKKESSIEYTNVSIGDYKYDQNKLTNTNTFIIHEVVPAISVNFKENVAKYEVSESENLDYFEKTEVDLQLTSFNDINSDQKKLTVLRLPTVEDVKKSDDFGIEINGETYNYSEYGFQLTYNAFTDLDSNDIKFIYKDKEIPIDYKIELKEIDKKEKEYIVTFENSEDEYDFPFIVSRRPLHSAMMYSTSGLGLLATGFFFKKKFII